jgi:Sec-independent protein translocase protein TatA
VGFRMEILFALVVGLLVFGPERLHTILGRMARARVALKKQAAASCPN